MAQYTAVLEQADDGSWSAYALTPTVAIGVGDSKLSALEYLQSGLTLWLDHRKQTGQTVPVPTAQYVSLEIVA
jgi:predicted RNase H-like HicB family nuclease